jgi:hypothetical protein
MQRCLRLGRAVRQPLGEGTKWENAVTARSTRLARMYEPGAWVSRVSPTPLLMVVASHDATTLTNLALTAYEQALEPKKLVVISGGHFAPYMNEVARSRHEPVSVGCLHPGRHTAIRRSAAVMLSLRAFAAPLSAADAQKQSAPPRRGWTSHAGDRGAARCRSRRGSPWRWRFMACRRFSGRRDAGRPERVIADLGLDAGAAARAD